MFNDNRFKKFYNQVIHNIIEIWIDKETKVNYLFQTSGYAFGLTSLLDCEGKVVITSLNNI